MTRFPIARLRCTHATRTRTLHWRDRNLHFHRYDQIEPSPQIDDLLREIGRDPTAIFRGQDGQAEAFRQFQYPTVPLGVSGDFMNTMMRRALDTAFTAGEEAEQ